MEWAIEECKKTNLPVAASMCIGAEGDMHGVSAAECAIRMARAGADMGKGRMIQTEILELLLHFKNKLKNLKMKNGLEGGIEGVGKGGS